MTAAAERSAPTTVPAEPAPGGVADAATPGNAAGTAVPAREIGGPRGPEPTRYGDWERAGRCIDF